jgi:hypothetical protein
MAILPDRTELITPADGDLYVTTDVSDTTDAVTGTDKKITWASLKAAFKAYFDTLYAVALGADDNYVTDAEKAVIANTTGTNSGDNAVNTLYSGLVTNATHTGEVTGSGALTVDKTAITGKTAVTAVGTDYVLISDTSDTGNLKKALVSDFTGSGLSDGDKGDITVSASGATWTIDNGAVTLAKQADMATASVVYRKTIGVGAPEVQTIGTLKTDLGLTGTNSGDQTSIVGITGTKAQFDTAVTDGNFLYVGDVTSNATHTGDATGSGALTVVALNGTNLAALGTGVLKNTTTTGVPFISKVALTEPATAATLTIANNQTLTVNGSATITNGTHSGTNTGDQTTIVGITGTKAQFDTAVSDGNIMYDGDSITNATATANRVFYSDNSGVITELALGADGTYLKSNGAAVAPSFATPAGSGDVSKVGTPVDNQIGVWTGSGTIEGDSSLTWDANSLIIDKTGTEALLVRKDADAGDILTVDTTNSQVAIGKADANVASKWGLRVSGDTIIEANIGVSAYTADANAGGISSYKARGTIASPTATQADDYLMINTGRGYGTTGFPVGSKGVISVRASQTWTDANQGTYIGFETTPDNSTTRAERVKITSLAVLPTTNDAIALGNTTNQFSDLFLAEGGVINWDNGDATLTQTGNTVELAGAAFKYQTAIGGVSAIGNLGATETIDWSTHTHYTGTLDSNITFTYSNQVSGETKTLYLSYDGTAQRTITWPTTTWLDNATGAAPATPSASGKVLVVTLAYIGTTTYASATGNYGVYA